MFKETAEGKKTGKKCAKILITVESGWWGYLLVLGNTVVLFYMEK